MNPTSLEYLYQIAPPVPDRAPTTSRGDDDSSGFDNHLSQAASTVFDVVRSPSQPTSRPSYSPPRPSPRENNDTSPSESAIRPTTSKPPQKDKSNDDSSAQASPTPASDKPSATSRDDDEQDDKHDQNKSDDSPVAAAAGAAHPATQDAAKSADDTSHDAGQGAADQAKDKIAAAEISKVPSAETKFQPAVDTKAIDKAEEATTDLKAGVIVAKTGRGPTAAAQGATGAASDKGDATSKTSKSAARATKAKITSTASDAAQNASQDSKSSKSSATASDSTTAATASAPATTLATAEEQQSAAQPEAAPNSTAVGQTNHSHKVATNDNAQPDVPATPTATSVTTAVANVTVPSPVDAVADKPKQSDGDAAKPIEAKTDATVGPLGRTLRTDLSGSSKTSNSGETSPVDVARFVSRVAKAVQTANDRDGVVQLRLSPPELGALKIQLTVKDGVMSAALEADNSNARRMLLDHLPALRDRLADQNIRVDRFDVDVKQENNGGQANPRGSNQNPYQQQAQETESRRTAVKTPQVSEALPVESAVAARQSTATGINLVI